MTTLIYFGNTKMDYLDLFWEHKGRWYWTSIIPSSGGLDQALYLPKWLYRQKMKMNVD